MMTQQSAPKILVIDDEVTQRMLVKEYLEEAGYLVRLSEDGKHGMKMAASTSPDLILVDVLLPSVDGYQVCSELRRHSKTADTPIILITASKEPDAIAKGLAAGATDFITKPVEFPFLADRVGHVIRKAQEIARLQAEKHSIEEKLRVTLSDQFVEAKDTPTEQLKSAEAKARAAEAAADAKLTKARADFDKEALRIRAEAQEQIAGAQSAIQATITANKEWLNREQSTIEAAATAEIVRSRALLEEARNAKNSIETELNATNTRLEAKIKVQDEALERARLHQSMAESAIAGLKQDHQQALRALRAAAENELRSATEALDQQAGAFWSFASALSSEFLRQIRSILESVSAASQGEMVAKGDEQLAGVASVTRELNISLANFNILARHLAGQIKLAETRVDVGAQLDHIAAAIEPACAKRKLRIETRVDPALSLILGDELHLRYLLMNLLSNALHFSPAGGTISIDARLQRDCSIRIAVRDQGVGMLPAALARINAALEPANMISSKGSAAGFGVPIATSIALLHGGRVEFESVFGAGTTATLVLPPERYCAKAGRTQLASA